MPFVGSVEGKTAFGRSPPPAQSSNIITNGLIIQLDASKSASYPGTGTTWFDITSTNNGTLTPTGTPPTYTAASPTYFSFDGLNQYVNIPNAVAIQPSIGGANTAIIWAFITSYTAASGDGVISKQFGSGGGYDGFSLVFNTNNRLQLNMNGQSINGIYVSANNNVFSLNTWTMFTCITRFGGGAGNPSKAYVNTTEVISAANSESGISQNNAPLRLISGIQEGSPYPACRSGSFYYYNRALSAIEISTMFEATRTRFGV
jgi:hypothetical protein